MSQHSSRTKVSIALWIFSAIATTNAPLAKLQWFVINGTNLCLELAQKRLLLNLSSEMTGKTLWKTKRPHHSCEGLRLTSSWLRFLHKKQNHSGRSEVFTVFCRSFLFVVSKMERVENQTMMLLIFTMSGSRNPHKS